MKTKVYTMNNILRSVLAVSLLFTIYGCVKDDKAPLNQENLHKVVFHAGWAPETKTVLQSDGSVWWSPGDEISLFTGGGDSGGYKLTSTNTAPAASADFVGEIGDKPENASYIAIYPYNTSNRVSGQNVYATIPQVQVAKEGTFEKNIFVSIAVSDNENLYFKNICSGIKFSVSTPGIKKVVITNKDNSTFTGEVQYNLENSTISSVSSNNSVTVTAPNEAGFETGKYYYAVIYPTTISTGFDIAYYTDNTVGKYTFNGSVEFKKGVFKRVYEKDKDITFYPNSENPAKLYASNFLPRDVDKTKITDVSFVVNSNKTTDISIDTYDDSAPIYFELDGTTANYYTSADGFAFDDASYLFFGWSSLKELNLSNIETSSVTNMSHMFAACYSLKSIKFGNFRTENVESMRGMFADCRSLESIDLSGFNTGYVKDMGYMFSGCSSIKKLDLSSFNTSKVEDMSFMFGFGDVGEPNIQQCQTGMTGCSSLEFLDLHSFNTSKVKDMQFMFKNCYNLKAVNLSGWNTTNVENMGHMFNCCVSLKSIDLSSFDTRNVLNMNWMFEACYNLDSLDLSNFQTSKVADMYGVFCDCMALQYLNISSFESSNVKNAGWFLYGNINLKHLDLGAFDLSKIENLNVAFNEVAKQSKYVAIRCVESSKQTLENLANNYTNVDFNLDYVKWVGINEAFPEPPSDVVNPDMYYSSDYSLDKKVKTLQTATIGNGVDIVIMGDAYSDRLIADGTYESDMREAIEAIFSVEPMKSYRNLFNVYMVYAVSQNEDYRGSTIFGIRPVGGVTLGNNLMSNVYTSIAVHSKPLSDVATIVIGHDINAFVSLGFTLTEYEYSLDGYYDYGQAKQCLALIGRWKGEDYPQTTIHEFGHLFAKLADEYVEKDEAIGTSDENEISIALGLMAHTGAYKNIDFTSDRETIKWSRFLNDSRYANEKLGAYEGGHLYSKGVWRPTEESIMRSSSWSHGFNAPSREAIYYRIHKIAYGVDWQYNYETFVQQDLKNIPSEPYFQSTVQNTPYPARVNKKHIFKMEKSIAPDGRKMITVIMD